MARQSSRVTKALKELDYLEDVLRISEDRDFVEIVGGQGGDVDKYRVYFDETDNVKCVTVK